jgi:hypothetical protein
MYPLPSTEEAIIEVAKQLDNTNYTLIEINKNLIEINKKLGR